jgi:hypothetical protein
MPRRPEPLPPQSDEVVFGVSSMLLTGRSRRDAGVSGLGRGTAIIGSGDLPTMSLGERTTKLHASSGVLCRWCLALERVRDDVPTRGAGIRLRSRTESSRGGCDCSSRVSFSD